MFSSVAMRPAIQMVMENLIANMRSIMRNKLLILYSCLFLIMLAGIMPVQAQNPEISLVLQQDSASVPRDADFAINVEVGPNSVDLKSYALEIQFDRNLIRTDTFSIVEGNLLEGGVNYTTFFWVGFSSDSGTLYIHGANLEPGEMIDGPGTLASIVFYSDPINFGYTSIDITDIQARDVDNADLFYDAVNSGIHICEHLLGDANKDGLLNVSDAVYIINYVFVSGSPAPTPLMIADANCDAAVNVSDAVYIVNYVFVDGPPPCRICY